MLQLLMGKKMTDDQKKRNLKIKLNRLITNDIKVKLWIKYYHNEFNVYCYQCKRRNINPYQCYWIHQNLMICEKNDIENKIIPVCKFCDLINDQSILI